MAVCMRLVRENVALVEIERLSVGAVCERFCQFVQHTARESCPTCTVVVRALFFALSLFMLGRLIDGSSGTYVP